MTSGNPISAGELASRSRWLKGRRLAAILVVAALLLVVLAAFVLVPGSADPGTAARVRRGDLVIRLNESGILRPAQSLTYRSPLGGRETELVFLAPEGTRVGEGDLVARVDTTDLDNEILRARQAVRAGELEAQVAQMEREEAVASLDSLTQGAKALEIDEGKANLTLAEKKLKRLRDEYEGLKPLLDKGYITKEEIDRSALELEQAEAEIEIARRRAGLLVGRTRPAEERRARLQLAQREAQEQQAKQKLEEAAQQLQALEASRQACSMYARRPGLVVYEEYMAASPRRKIRVGDRVTASQGLVTIPEVSRMLVESSVREADVHRLMVGQQATIRVDAYPDLRLSGRVVSVGALARTPADRPFEEKRFDFAVEVDPSSADLRPEMTVRLEIATGERKGVLLVPANAVFEQNGLSVVQVLNRWGTEIRQVGLGQSSDFEVEVMAGLREGETVALAGAAVGSSEPVTLKPSAVPTPSAEAPSVKRR